MTLKTPLHNEQGFTLVEVMIAITILAIGIFGTAKLQLSFMQSNTKARIITVGSAQSQEMIEELASRDYDDPLFNDGDGDGTGEDVDQNGIDDDAGNFGLDDETTATADGNAVRTQAPNTYNFFWNVAVDHPEAGLKTINVIVKWNDEKNIERRVNYTFIKGRM